MKLEDIHE